MERKSSFEELSCQLLNYTLKIKKCSITHNREGKPQVRQLMRLGSEPLSGAGGYNSYPHRDAYSLPLEDLSAAHKLAFKENCRKVRITEILLPFPPKMTAVGMQHSPVLYTDFTFSQNL